MRNSGNLALLTFDSFENEYNRQSQIQIGDKMIHEKPSKINKQFSQKMKKTQQKILTLLMHY
jgi:tRNA A22 N-methylase